MESGNEAGLAKQQAMHVICSIVPRPTCAFHFSVAVGLVHFLTCVMRKVEGW